MSNTAYDDYQSSRDREYAQAWEKLSPRERRRLEKAGITGPDIPVYRTQKRDDEALVERAGEFPKHDEPQRQVTSPCSSEELMAVVRRLLGELMSQDNIRLTLECLAIVTGMGYGGESMTAIARKHGVTRAAVSKRCVEITDAMNLPPSRAMKRLTARSAYEQRQYRVLHQDESFRSRKR